MTKVLKKGTVKGLTFTARKKIIKDIVSVFLPAKVNIINAIGIGTLGSVPFS